jgi:23S rRNA (adenine2503-C2)-methyltransferase
MQQLNVKEYQSSNENVKKIVFTKEDAVYEAVLYKYPTYEERTVLCVSVQSGCAVGCTFCGTGKKLIRNLTVEEILEEVEYALRDIDVPNVKRLQIMFMSMGEPFHNFDNFKHVLKKLYKLYPNAALLVSSIAPRKQKEFAEFLQLSQEIPNIGLQFSVHKSNDTERNVLIPFASKFTLAELRDYGIEWFVKTGRKPYFNYCVDGKNNTEQDYINIRNLFPPNVFCATLSVVCSADETMTDAGFRNLEVIHEFQQKFLKDGYNVRVFDPAGQDDIGGGCGQLWYVQDWMKSHKKVQ